jgi:hypothetical protein
MSSEKQGVLQNKTYSTVKNGYNSKLFQNRAESSENGIVSRSTARYNLNQKETVRVKQRTGRSDEMICQSGGIHDQAVDSCG